MDLNVSRCLSLGRAACLVALLSTLACGGAKAKNDGPREPVTPKLRLDDRAKPISYSVKLSLDPNKDTFSGSVDIATLIQRSTRTIWLNGTKLSNLKATLTSGSQSFDLTVLPSGNDDFIGLSAPVSIPTGPATIHVKYDGVVSDKDYNGIFRQKQDDRWYLFTQFESLGARRAFPSFDEPKFKVPFSVTLTVPADHVVASNTPQLQSLSSEGKTKTVRFAPSKPMPTYLVAFAVGPFDIVPIGNGGRNAVEMRILTPKGKASHTKYAAEVTSDLLERLEDYFDMPYPYEKLDSVAVPHFLGAMENPGLITYASSMILQPPGEDTPNSRRRYAGVATHELAHQWFGNLVTLSWWDDIWLNESFATWLSGKVVSAWEPTWKGSLSAIGSGNRAMGADSLVSARQIRQPINSNHDIYNAFDGISYQKGAATIRMFEAWMGDDAFRNALRSYMREHAWKTTTADDFLASLANSSTEDLPTAFRTFLNKPGVPLVHGELECGEENNLVLTQQRFLPTGSEGNNETSWKFPVCVRYNDGEKTQKKCELLDAPQAPMDLGKSCPDWVVLNAGAAGYYRSSYSESLLKKLYKSIDQLNPEERLGLTHDVRALVQAGKIDLGQSLALIPKLLSDPNQPIAEQAVRIAETVDRIVADELRPNYERFIQRTFAKRARKIGWKPRKLDTDDLRMFRPSILRLVTKHGEPEGLDRTAESLTLKWLSNPDAISPEMRSVVTKAAAHRGNKKLHEKLYQAAKVESDRTRRRTMLNAMAHFDEPTLLEKNLDILLAGEFEFREASTFLNTPTQFPKHREKIYQWMKSNFGELTKLMPEMSQRYLVYLPVSFCDEPHRLDAEAFFADVVDEMPGGPRSLSQAMESMKLCAAYKKAHAPTLESFLSQF